MDYLNESSTLSLANQNKIIIGVDEAGRGCLCGPVYAAAVSFKSDHSPKNSSSTLSSGKNKLIYKDSKLLSSSQRESLYEDILSRHWVGVGFATCIEVDKINILQASLLAMKRAVENLKTNYLFEKPEEELEQSIRLDLTNSGHVIVDGNKLIPGLEGSTQSFMIKGDQLVSEISAASIVAKVSRDRYLDQLDSKYPEYEFRKHKGYGTALHRSKIKEFGPCPEHRTTFKGVREFLHLKTQ